MGMYLMTDEGKKEAKACDTSPALLLAEIARILQIFANGSCVFLFL